MRINTIFMKSSTSNHHILPYPNFHSKTHRLRKAAIIPDIIDSKDWKPQCYVVPIYKKDKKHEKYVTLGNTIKPKKTQKKPDVKIYCPGKEVTTGMTVVLTDPDAPSRKDPKWSEMCHWIAGVPASKPEVDESEGLLFEVEGGKKPSSKYDIVDCELLCLRSYESMNTNGRIDKPPGPPPKTGKHRYVFLLLEGDNTNLTIPEDRKHWGFGKEGYGVKDWAKREGLEVVGANFFYAKNKDKTKH